MLIYFLVHLHVILLTYGINIHFDLLPVHVDDIPTNFKYICAKQINGNICVPMLIVIFVTVFPYGYRKNTFQEHCNSYCQGTLISYSTFYKFFAVYIFRKPSG
jgi:hypothetical protein